MNDHVAVDPRYLVNNADEVFTPALAVYPEIIRENIALSIRMAGGPSRLRPHSKTHKTIELTRLELEAGIAKHKCATIAEAEILAEAGAPDVLVAYPIVGPNVQRFVHLQQRHPSTTFSCLVDHPHPLTAIAEAHARIGKTANLYLDIDCGQGRTGIEMGKQAGALYRRLTMTNGARAAGLHVYDGHNNAQTIEDRMRTADSIWTSVKQFVSGLEYVGLPVPRLVCGGSPSFPGWAKLATEDSRIECSPGTFYLNDWNYYGKFKDLKFQPAAVLMTRVISKPRPGRLTVDLGHKAVAGDPAVERRVKFLGIPGVQIQFQSEEHLVIDTPVANSFEPGDLLYAWPGHICPTCALHRQLYVVVENKVVETWSVAARDRLLHC